jgi:hypothetical protein
MCRPSSLEHLTIEWRKTCTRTDEALGRWSILEDKMPERNHPRRYTLELCITDYRTPTPISYTLDDESECITRICSNRISAIESWSELEHDVLTRLGHFTYHIWTAIDELIDVMRDEPLGDEGELSFEHCIKKSSQIMRRFWFFTRENLGSFFEESILISCRFIISYILELS